MPDPKNPERSQFRTTIDIETGGLNKRWANRSSSVSDFFELSQDAAKYRQSSFFRQSTDPSGKPYQLLEFFGTNDPLDKPHGFWKGFSPSSPNYLHPDDGYAVSNFAIRQGIKQRASAEGAALGHVPSGKFLTESEFAGEIFSSIHRRIGANQEVVLQAWNGLYDISFLETIAHRHEDLSQWRGFMGRMAGEGKLRYVGVEDSLFDLAFAYGQQNKSFADKYFRARGTGKLVQSAAEMRDVPFWSLENVAAQSDLYTSTVHPDLKAHSAFADANVTERLADMFVHTKASLSAGKSWDEALQASGLATNGHSAEEYFTGMFNGPWQRQFAAEKAAGAELLGKSKTIVSETRSLGKYGIWTGIGVAAAIAARLAFGNRSDRQTQIEALRHDGVMADRRKHGTDFGSGWRGLDDDPINPAFKGLALGGGLYAAHQYGLRNKPNYRSDLLHYTRLFEERSPNHISKTLGFGDRASQYVINNLSLDRDKIFRSWTGMGDQPGNVYSDVGDHLSRLLGSEATLRDLDWANPATVLNFRRDAGETGPYLRMHVGETPTAHKVSFAEKGYLTGSSARYGANYSVSGTEHLGPYAHTIDYEHAGETLNLQPYLAKTEGKFFENTKNVWGRRVFAQSERINKLLEEVHLGLKPGSYKSSAGLVGNLLMKRVLPAYLLWKVAGYADYATGHVAGDAAWSLWPKANLLRAEATDTLPGARRITDWYKDHVTGPQYGPLALPLGGMLVGGMVQAFRVMKNGEIQGGAAAKKLAAWGKPVEFLKDLSQAKWSPKKLGPAGAGLLIGSALMAAFVPGMLGSRKTAAELRSTYSGETPVEVRSGRWWEIGATPFSGNRITMSRPHAYALHKARAEAVSVYGSEEEKWAHDPLVSPLGWLKDPGYLEKKHYADRPYPVSSPAFSNVPLIGPILATTIGRIVKPPHRMHEEDWDGQDYTLSSRRLEPRGPEALAPSPLQDEFSLKHVAQRERTTFLEMIGLPGFLMRSVGNHFSAKDDKPDVFFEGSRNLDNTSSRYYERELGAVAGVKSGEVYGFSEPLRRFIQREDRQFTANEIPNLMPSWMPDQTDNHVDFHKGDPFNRVPMGFARLPGPGYESLHPEVAGLDPEDYPDLVKLRILGDVAPWSGGFKQLSAAIGRQAEGDTQLKIEYEQIVERNRRMKESTINVSDSKTGPVQEVEGTVEEAGDSGIRLKEYPAQIFRWSGISTKASDLSVLAMAAGNRDLAAAANDVDRRNQSRLSYMSQALEPGTRVRAVIDEGALDSKDPQAVIFAGGVNLNRDLLEQGFAKSDLERAGPEIQAMDGFLGRMFRNYSETLAGMQSNNPLNPMRYIPTPVHSKLWQQRTPLQQYIQEEVTGSRMRRWHRPVHDMLKPWFYGTVRRFSGQTIVPEEAEDKRDLHTLSDELSYLRAIYGEANDPEHRGKHKLAEMRTAIGADLYSDPRTASSGLNDRDHRYFWQFLKERNPDQRSRILNVVSKETSDVLFAQWHKEASDIARANGQEADSLYDAGRTVDEDERKQLEKGHHVAGLAAGDLKRARTIAEFFKRRGLRLPEPDDEIMSSDIDYSDVKVKLIQWEGLDYHDFNIYDDQVAQLWRKPYLDGAVRELTSGDSRSADDTTYQIEQAIALSKAKDPNAQVKVSRRASRVETSNVKITMRTDSESELRKQAREMRDEQ